MKEEEKIIPNDILEIEFLGTNFGKHSPRAILNNTVLKCASGYSTGHTAKYIAVKLKLVTDEWELTPKGREYLFEAYSNGVSI